MVNLSSSLQILGDAGIVERPNLGMFPLIVIDRSDYDSKVSFEQAPARCLRSLIRSTVIVLAGYMRIVGTQLLNGMSIRF